jgi:hypothetical protein
MKTMKVNPRIYSYCGMCNEKTIMWLTKIQIIDSPGSFRGNRRFQVYKCSNCGLEL